jgi:uncharacterized membrane protein
MEAVLFTLLIIAVLLLWSRVSSLESKLRELQDAVRILRRGPKAASETSPAPPPVQRPSQAEAPAAQQVSGEVSFATPTQVAVAPASAPPVDSWLVRLVREYFTGGNLVVRVGIIVLFFGVAFLLKYAAQHTQLSIQMRLGAVAMGACGLFVLGWVLRERRRGFSLALQGGAVGVLYLTLFAALRLYALIPPGTTFALMAGLGVISCLLAIRQDALALSMLGATGGFLAPVLASTGEGSHVVLFGYYALLNVFIVAQAWFKAWRPLNLLAFVFTFGIGTFWGVTRYEPALFATTEPFLLFFFLAFIAIAILFAFRAAPRLTHYVDGTLVFGTPVVAMALQMQLVRDISHGRAWSALGAGVVYLGLAAWLHGARRHSLQMLRDSFVALGIAFLTMAVPLWFDDTWTTATWALEGAALLWTGLRQDRRLPTAAGLLLQLLAAALFVVNLRVTAATPLANATFMGALVLAIAGLTSAHVALRPGSILRSSGPTVSSLLLAWGLGWWLYAGGNEVQTFVPAAWHSGAFLGLCTLTALACAALVRPLSWPALRVPALLLLPVMMLAVWAWLAQQLHPFSEGGWLAWPAAFAVLCLSARWHEASIEDGLAAVLHGLTLWLLGLLVSWELGWQIQQGTAAGTVWSAAAWALAPAVMLMVLASDLVEQWWPLCRHPRDFRRWVAGGLAVFLVVWSLWLNWVSDGSAAPLPYLPLANPLDITVGVALLAVARWLRMVWRADTDLFARETQRMMVAALTGAVFFWLNAVLLRTFHYLGDVPYQFEALAADTSVQAALSIFWTLLALGTMLWANRNALRVLWFGGAGLMGVVVAKLFVVDLVHVGTLPRIVSFLVVGGLMLVIGYFSPLPPAKTAATA